MSPTFDYMLVDDDSTSNLISKLLISEFIKPENIYVFSKPENGLHFIDTYSETKSENPIILFLDINMPTMTGWEFLERFENLDNEKKKYFNIIILSSAIQDFSWEAERFPFVMDFISKPLKLEKLKEIASEFSMLIKKTA